MAVKAINPDKKSDTKLYMLRNVNKDDVGILTRFREIFDQFGEVVSSDFDFDMGYYRNNKCINYGSEILMTSVM